MLSDRYQSCLCLSRPVCLFVCNVGVLWPNSWMDQAETWYRGKPRPRPHCFRWDRALPERGTTPTFPPTYSGQTAGWIKMSLGTEVGLGPSHIVLAGDSAPPKGAQPPISAFCWLTTTQISLHNQLSSRYRSHRASYSNFSPKIGSHGNVSQHLWTPI